MNPKTILTILKKELLTYINNPANYLVVIVFLIFWEYLFFRNAFLVGEASLRILFSYVPWLFIIFVPALTMGSIANEKSEGTLEFLLTNPVRSIELIFGKFFASVIFSTTALLFIFPIAFTFSQFGDLDWGVVIGQFLGSVLLAAVFTSIGLFISSLFTSQIAALLGAVAINFFLVISGFELITLSLPTSVARFFENLSVLSHFDSIARGIVDLRDIWYFLAVIGTFLSLCYLQMLKLRLGNQKQIFQQYSVSVALFVGIAFLVNIVGARYPFRYDLTEDKIYQLTNTTKDTLTNLEDVVNIKFYASQELPAQLRPILRDAKDILNDYRLYGDGNINVEIKDPLQDQNAVAEANSLGIREVQFNVIGQEELQLKKGYLGLAVLYGGETEIIPLISNTSDLEYQLTSFIKKLTTDEQKTITFLEGFGQKSIGADYQVLNQELSKLYQVDTLTISEEDPEDISADTSVLAITGSTEPIPEEIRGKIADYFNNGGSVYLLLDGVAIDQNTLTATINTNSFADFANVFGIEILNDIVYDLRSNETVNFGGGNGINYILPYPFWPRVISKDKTSPIVNKLSSVVFPWPSSLTINQDKANELGFEVKKLLATTEFGGAQLGNFTIQPDQQLLPNNLEEKVVAVSLRGAHPEW